MARPVRIEYAGAIYHVMAGGNQGRPIFADDLDRKAWMDTLGPPYAKTGWRIHAWVLMRIHEVFTFRFRQMIPIQPAPGGGAAQLAFAEADPFLSFGLGGLREGQQSSPLAGGWQLPYNRDHLLIIQLQEAHGIEQYLGRHRVSIGDSSQPFSISGQR